MLSILKLCLLRPRKPKAQPFLRSGPTVSVAPARLQNRLLFIVLLLVLPTVGASLVTYRNSVQSQQTTAEVTQLEFTKTRAREMNTILAELQIHALQLVAAPPLLQFS